MHRPRSSHLESVGSTNRLLMQSPPEHTPATGDQPAQPVSHTDSKPVAATNKDDNAAKPVVTGHRPRGSFSSVAGGAMVPSVDKTHAVELKENYPEPELKCLAALRERVRAELGEEHEKNVPDHTFIRFVRARKLDLDGAFNQYTKTVAWRKKYKVEQYREFDVVELRVLVPESFHGFDKHGWPSYIVKAGKVEPSQVRQMTVQDFVKVHIWGNEYSLERAEIHGRELGRPVDRFSNIVDLDGLALKHRKVLPYIKAVAKIDERYYPEVLGHTFIVNPPFLFSMFWSIVRPWLDPVTASKISVLGSDFKQQLLKHYDADQLPVEYGGTCKCDGGCVPVAKPEDVARVLKSQEAKIQLTTVHVKARDSFHVTHQTPAHGSAVRYYFRTDDNDIRFQIVFTPDEAKDKPITIYRNSKVASYRTPEKETFDVYTAGKIQITWDNTYSYWTDKTLHYQVVFEDHDEALEPDPDEKFPLNDA